MSIVEFLREMQAVAHRADRERLSMLIEDFEGEYPEYAAHIRHCATLPDAKSALNYLSQINQSFALLNFVPDIERVISFVQNEIRERAV